MPPDFVEEQSKQNMDNQKDPKVMVSIMESDSDEGTIESWKDSEYIKLSSIKNIENPMEHQRKDEDIIDGESIKKIFRERLQDSYSCIG